ncbi:hypothetical protein HPB48_017589 [Haemaphysalis longicornis]|uniref:Uncharacterized protein n=1 Tax=Haemaphysalis longicornis TaxID=44386 RepID=A0A9J6GTR9_HAELO|nr:hypothetical protein HPB48_017588 [Haemaphysalis longicornis]KAH9378902.1 hypothetical protein HPB48_017589 [Haemaphysalis longicornis]
MLGKEKLTLHSIGNQNNGDIRSTYTAKNLDEANSMAWLVKDPFEQNLQKLEDKHEKQKRKGPVFVDNCGVHGYLNTLKRSPWNICYRIAVVFYIQ